jgi:zinc protease
MLNARCSALFGLLAVAVLHQSAAAAEPAGSFPYPVHVETLDNGLQAVVVPMPSPGVVATAVWMDVGSRNEVEPGRTGFAHFFEHLMFSGTPDLPRDERERALMRLGIGDNAWTWLDETVYHALSDTRSLDDFLALQADMMQNVALTPDGVRREAGAVYGEYRKTQADPAFHLEQALNAAAFTSHPYSHDTLGYEADIAAMPQSHEYALQFYARWYRPENATVLLVGDIEPEDGLTRIEQHFGAWEPGDPEVERPEIPAEPPQEEARSATVPWPADVPRQLLVGWHVPAHDPTSDTFADVAALQVASGILLGRTGRLTNRLVRTEGLALKVGGGALHTVDPGLFTIHVTMAADAGPDAVERARAIIDDEIARLAEGVDDARAPGLEAELARTRSHLRYSTLTDLDAPETVLYHVGSRLRRGAGPDALGALEDAVAAVDREALAAAVGRWLVDTNRTTVTLLPNTAPSADAAPEVDDAE